MGLFSAIFGRPVDKVSPEIRLNSELAGEYMKEAHPSAIQFGDFVFEYLYVNSEPITQSGIYGSVIYIRVTSSENKNLAGLPTDSSDIQNSIDEHQAKYSDLPRNLFQDKTRWMYFNMGTIFRVC
jgi:hypothetical protein